MCFVVVVVVVVIVVYTQAASLIGLLKKGQLSQNNFVPQAEELDIKKT